MSVRGVKGKRRKRKPAVKPDNKAQSERFIKAAKLLGVEGKAFERAMDTLLSSKRKNKDEY